MGSARYATKEETAIQALAFVVSPRFIVFVLFFIIVSLLGSL